MNSKREVRIEKVTLNIGVGGPGDKLEKAGKLLNVISGSKIIQTRSGPTTRIPTWGVRPNLPLACKVTVRGKKAEELLKRLLQAVENRLSSKKFDKFGNFSFGIPEYIDIPDVPYDPSIGVIGLEAAVTLQRPGFRVKRKSVHATKIGARHAIKKEEAMEYLKTKFNLTIGDRE